MGLWALSAVLCMLGLAKRSKHYGDIRHLIHFIQIFSFIVGGILLIVSWIAAVGSSNGEILDLKFKQEELLHKIRLNKNTHSDISENSEGGVSTSVPDPDKYYEYMSEKEMLDAKLKIMELHKVNSKAVIFKLGWCYLILSQLYIIPLFSDKAQLYVSVGQKYVGIVGVFLFPSIVLVLLSIDLIKSHSDSGSPKANDYDRLNEDISGVSVQCTNLVTDDHSR